MERYTDEKLPQTETVYLDAVELQQLRPKRPLWRRIVRSLFTIGAIFMVWCAITPVFHAMRHGCKRTHSNIPKVQIPEKHMVPPLDMDMEHHMDIPMEHYTFPSDLKNFWIKQESFHLPTRTNVIGNLIIHSCDKAEKISAHFKFDLSDPTIRSDLTVEPSEDGIVFKLDPVSLSRQTVNATIFLVLPKSKDYELDELNISTINLPIWIKDTVTTKVNCTDISAVSGSIINYGKAANKNALDMNNLRIKTVSGSIDGEFPLNHALDLETTNGNINADIVSSDLKEEIGYLKTSTVNGNHNIEFISKLNPRPLYSTHNSVNGDVEVTYPEDWQGDLKLKTTSGHIVVAGKGTKIDKKESSPVGRFWKVVKGVGKSKGSVSTISGKIDILIGEKEDKA